MLRLCWFDTPCTTFSSVQNMRKGGPLRSPTFPWGVSGLPPHQHAAVLAGNTFLRFTCSMLAICRRMRIPSFVENPHASGLWRNPLMQKVLAWKEVQQHVTDYCQFSMPWRKRTRVLSMFCDLNRSVAMCRGTCGKCSCTGLPHVRLMGRVAGQGDRTKLAEPYPKQWCSALVFDMIVSLRNEELAPIIKGFC